ncbi:hypothetical protein E2C01_094688 [Portunus trituberculatus]|uniref:Uncharacterized protein n=1 Tax=Portunus trituberculatus TaxID=210409 RepID=A0A5B7JXW1_PORTR|nr:hypothetical protein [Portunus trituberculatus]
MLVPTTPTTTPTPTTTTTTTTAAAFPSLLLHNTSPLPRTHRLADSATATVSSSSTTPLFL